MFIVTITYDPGTLPMQYVCQSEAEYLELMTNLEMDYVTKIVVTTSLKD